MTYEQLKKGVVKRTERREVGLFIDGTGLDRATRRLNRKVDLSALVRGVTSGLPLVVARYYTLIPYEDDARQHAFLDAVARAGMRVVIKRLPPKGVTRQVSVDVEMAADLAAFALGHYKFSDLSEYKIAPSELDPAPNLGDSPIAKAALFPPSSPHARLRLQANGLPNSESEVESTAPAEEPSASPERKIKRVATVVCPSRDIAYAIALAKELGADTVNADFGQYTGGDVLKSAAKWIDLSDSETIWRE